MRFVDECRVKVIAGSGGNGSVAFRREKFIPFGGPAGGDGGRGGDVVFVGDEGLSTLLDFTHARTIEAKRGEHGSGSDCHGRGGADREERVPVGTQIFDDASGRLLFDVTRHAERVVVARGGRGGRGNLHFATPEDRAPRRAEKGEPGQIRELRLELKVLADVGLLGFPNVGKSTFVARVSAARPKVADYPFTTLTPVLGVVAVGGGARAGGSSFVIADIPGLLPGASEGVGLGLRFLRHVERTRALLHLVTLDPGEGREPFADYVALRHELEAYSPDLARHAEILVLTKADLPDVREAYPALRDRFATLGKELLLASAATGEGVDTIVNRAHAILGGRVAPGDEPPRLPETTPRASGGKATAGRSAPATVAKKAAPTKAATKTGATRKSAPEAAPTRAVTKKAAPTKASRKTATRKATPTKASRRTAPKKATPTKRAPAKEPAPKKAAPKKAAAKKAAPTKAAAKKGARPR